MNLRGHALCHAFHQPIRNFLNNNPGSYLEIGVYYGHFFAELANEYPDRPFYGIDPFISDGYTRDPQGTVMTDIEEIARHNAAETKNATLYKYTTEDFLKTEEAKDILKNVSCVLIDGSHHYVDIVHDLDLVMEINNDLNKFVAFDDLQIEDVRKSISELTLRLHNRIINVENHPHYVGIHFK